MRDDDSVEAQIADSSCHLSLRARILFAALAAILLLAGALCTEPRQRVPLDVRSEGAHPEDYARKP